MPDETAGDATCFTRSQMLGSIPRSGTMKMLIEKLQKGETVQFRPHGSSMKGKVESGDLVTVEPIGTRDLVAGNIVFCKVKGNVYLHLVKAIRDGQYQIGNNRGGINGWISKNSIYGICTKVEGSTKK
jgi:hypothetical protein